jgi:hypothetical protein
MNAGHRAPALALAAALFIAAHGAGSVCAQQTDPPRRPQGPVAGPVIKLPPGSGATEGRTQTGAGRDEAAPAPAAPQRWEYCVISGFRYHQKGISTSTPSAYVRYISANSSEEVEGANEEEALDNAIAKLGEDGWELAAVRTDLTLKEGDGRTTSVYFFKRPR